MAKKAGALCIGAAAFLIIWRKNIWQKPCRNMSMLALLRKLMNLPTKFTFFVNKIA